MGGFGSGKIFRLTPAKKRTRVYTHEVPFIDYRSVVVEDRTASNPKGNFCYKGEIFPFPMSKQVLPRGGVWYAFLCECRKAVQKLYVKNGRFACRCCHSLAYWSENRGKADRANDQKWKHLKKISCESAWAIRPKWMKKAAFEKKEEKIEFYAYLANAHFFGWKDVLKEMKAIKKEILRSVEG